MADVTTQMYNYIVKDAADDIDDVLNGVRELNRISPDPQLDAMIQSLVKMKSYIQGKVKY